MIDTVSDMSLSPLADHTAVMRHMDILDGLRLDLKIATDGYPELKNKSPFMLCCELSRIHGKKGKALSGIFHAASAVYCHELYFKHIVSSDKYPSIPNGDAEKLLSHSFGSTGNFFYLVRTLAQGSSNPGFLWLYRKNSIVKNKRILGLARLPLYSIPDINSVTPLMCIDLWEHAYIDNWNRDISGYADAYLRQTDWNTVFSDPL
ncbi:MAG: hypothetical protein E7578_07610 [Ruminococcaceae bacterium]|nr:hypothetical protein [Oscillospiraceae bacterium]